MRFILIGVVSLLSFCSAMLYLTLPEQRVDIPVLYWMTGGDPIKRETIDLFYEWREERGLEPVELRIDYVNKDQTKRLITGVSGVGGDLIDIYESDFALFHSTGMLRDLTEIAPERGITPDRTYASYRDYFVWNDVQYGFPRNIGVQLMWVNLDTFARHGVEPPPRQWDWDEFEALGIRYIEAANEEGSRDRNFFLDNVNAEFLRRGLGLAAFNETMTASTHDDPRSAEVYRRIQRWTNELRLMPTRQEAAAYAADSAGSANRFSFFDSGRYAMIFNPRWALIILRQRGKFNMDVVELPTSGFRNTLISGGTVGVYQGTQYPEIAYDFLEFLTTERFNLLIARSGDSLPPLPEYAEHPQFTQPPGFEEEWGLHEQFAKAAREIAIPFSMSPYVLQSTVTRIELSIVDALVSGRLTPEEAAQRQSELIEAEIRFNLRHNPSLQKDYATQVAIQEKIDARRAAGEPIPLAWIRNPFHRVYYAEMGWLEEEDAL